MNPGQYLMLSGTMVSCLALSFILTEVLHLEGRMVWIVRMLITALGLACHGLFIWIQSRRKGAKAGAEAGAGVAAAPAGAPLAPSSEIHALMSEAEARLGASRLGKDAKLGTLPAVFLIGQSGSAKTSTMVNCGAEPELLSGQIFQEGAVAPTRVANLWFARQTIFVETAGSHLGDGGLWSNLMRRLQPPKLKWVFTRREQAPRAAVVCVDCESFLQAGGQDSLAQTARSLHARLEEIANALGIHLPVYVLFTRTDRLTYFFEYVRNLTDKETTQVLGATLPIVVGGRQGVYAEEETRRLSDAFTELFYSLCDKRPPFLSREHDATKLGGIYEFPREFRKLRASAVQFLVDVCRPSQLQTSPFLRGFYFSGVRPIEVRDAAPAVRTSEPQPIGSQRDASGMFRFRAGGEPEAVPVAPQVASTRRVPQWLFLTHLFNDVILADRGAVSTSAKTVRMDVTRRALLLAGAALCLIASIAFTVSYSRNRSLESRVMDAARGASAAGTEVASLDSLRRLDSLRESSRLLSEYSRDGAPWSLRWGLYTGDAIFPTVRRLYFNRFHKLLFGATQDSLLDWLRKLPSAPGPADEYSPTYDTLKAYLMTTSHHDKATRLFLSPLLTTRWSKDRGVDPERLKLGQQQFDFYSDELKISNPFSSENDGLAVTRARHYLAQFAATERIYQFMLAEASRKFPSVNFNRQFPGSAQVVTNNRDVAGAYSKDGWAFMLEAIKNPERFFGGEDWVLGPQSAAALDRSKLGSDLLDRYHADYIAHWREYLRNSSIVRYASVDDAARKLSQLSNNQSFLLALFCVASVNTSVADERAKAPFQPVQFVTPPACPDQYIGGSNREYMSALSKLQSSLEQAARGAHGPNDPAVTQTIQDAAGAKQVTRQVAQNFHLDKEGHVEQMTQKLMEDPITYAEALLGRLGPAQLNGEGKRFCGEFLQLTNKYPFNTSSQVDATLKEVSDVFKPGDGLLWTFYESNLKSSLVREGSQYVAGPNAGVHITPAFVRFFNRAVLFSEALYKPGTAEPHLTFSLKALPSDGVQSMTLTVDGQTLKSTGGGGTATQMAWPGASVHEAKLDGSLGGPEFGFLNYGGVWAVFRLFGDADKWQEASPGFDFEWVPRQGQSAQPMMVGGKPLTVRVHLEMSTKEPIFRKGYLAGFQCVSQVAQ